VSPDISTANRPCNRLSAADLERRRDIPCREHVTRKLLSVHPIVSAISTALNPRVTRFEISVITSGVNILRMAPAPPLLAVGLNRLPTRRRISEPEKCRLVILRQTVVLCCRPRMAVPPNWRRQGTIRIVGGCRARATAALQDIWVGFSHLSCDKKDRHEVAGCGAPTVQRAAAVGENWMAGGNLFVRRTELPSQDALPMQQQRRAVLLEEACRQR
jgi:hypothetical protein